MGDYTFRYMVLSSWLPNSFIHPLFGHYCQTNVFIFLPNHTKTFRGFSTVGVGGGVILNPLRGPGYLKTKLIETN